MTKEERKEYMKQYYQENKEKFAEYFKTPIGRAYRLVQNYKQSDKEANRGECTLTAEWVVENIFTKKCAHCNKSGWQIIGCNRLDNSRPHTEDNVEPCCLEHNVELATEEKKQILAKQVYQYAKDGKLVNIWESTAECGKNGYDQGTVSKCCNSERKTHKGYKWSYNPIKTV